MKIVAHILTLAAVLAAITLPAVARDSGPAEFTKVKTYLLDDSKRPVGAVDRMITFERRYHLHGAVSREEMLERFGNYYAFFWKSRDRAPVTLRFEYRQRNTGSEIKVAEIDVPSVKKSNITKLDVTGEDFAENGPVTSWQASLVSDGAVVASTKSFLWD